MELINRKLTGNNYHQYINPERDSDPGALAVHGLTTEFLSDKPKFADIAADFCAYIKGAELIIHNAPFDMGFLEAELAKLAMPRCDSLITNVIDTLVIAKQMHPGKRNSLDALCDRYGISNAHRQLHGALLDAELLADVYLSMSRGQNSLVMDEPEVVIQTQTTTQISTQETVKIMVKAASEEELNAHQKTLESLDKAVKGHCIWHS